MSEPLSNIVPIRSDMDVEVVGPAEQSVVDFLKIHLRLAYQGKIRGVAIAYVNEDENCVNRYCVGDSGRHNLVAAVAYLNNRITR